MLAMNGVNNFETAEVAFGETTWNICYVELFHLLLFDLFITNSWKSVQFCHLTWYAMGGPPETQPATIKTKKTWRLKVKFTPELPQASQW